MHIEGGFHSDLTFERATGKLIAEVSCFSDEISVRILEEFLVSIQIYIPTKGVEKRQMNMK